MSSTTIQQVYSIKQDTKEGIVTVIGLALTRLLHKVIREYGHYDHASYVVNLNDIDLCDQKLLLSYVTDSSEYKEALENQVRFNSYFKEYSSYIQHLIDDECHNVYIEDQEDARAYA